MSELERIADADGDGLLEIRVSEKLEAALLNKIARKSGEIREQIEVGLRAGQRFRAEFSRQRPAAESAEDMVDAAEAVRAVYADLMQVLDIAETAGVSEIAVREARWREGVQYRWGIPE